MVYGRRDAPFRTKRMPNLKDTGVSVATIKNKEKSLDEKLDAINNDANGTCAF